MSAMHFAGWKMGLKTGMYYLRSKPATGAIKFTVDKQRQRARQSESKENEPEMSVKVESTKSTNQKSQAEREREEAALICSLEDPDACLMCSGWMSQKSFAHFSLWKTTTKTTRYFNCPTPANYDFFIPHILQLRFEAIKLPDYKLFLSLIFKKY